MRPSFFITCFVGAFVIKADGFQIRNSPRNHVTGSFSPMGDSQWLSTKLKSPLITRIRSQTSHSSTRDENSGGERENSSLSERANGFLVLLTVPLAWGTYVPVVRYLYEIQPPVPGFVFSACYYFVAAATLLTITWAQQHRAQDESQASGSTISDTIGTTASPSAPTTKFPFVGGLELGTYLFLGNGLQVLGLKTVPSDRAGFLVQLTTVMVPLVQGAFAGNLLSIPVRTWLACAIAFSGVLVMGADGTEAPQDFVNADIIGSFSTGDLLIVLSAFVYTMHVVRLEKYAKLSTPVQLGASKSTFEAIFSIGLVVALLAVAAGTDADSSNGLLSFASESGQEISNFFRSMAASLATGSLPSSALLPALGAVLWTGWVTCAYTITAQTFGQSRVTATEANLIYSVQPLFTAAFAYFLLGETLSPLGAVGGGLIAGAVYMVASAPSQDGGRAESPSQASAPTDDGDSAENPSPDSLNTSAERIEPPLMSVDAKSTDERVLEDIGR